MTSPIDLETRVGLALRSAAEAVTPSVEDLVRAAERRGAVLRRRRSRSAVALASGTGLLAASVVAVVPRIGGGGATPPVPPATSGPPPAACASAPSTGPLPEWASAGFTDPQAGGTPYVVGDRGRIAAILFGTLSAPEAKDHANKVLWVSRSEQVPMAPLRIRAELRHGPGWLGPAATVSREVTGGPGPSYLELPSPGCWHLDLTWDNGAQQDTMDLYYATPG